MTRSFRMVSVEKGTPVDGTFTGTPSAAARKAFNSYCRKNKKDKMSSRFEMQEITRDSNNKTYAYRGERKNLNPPKIVKRGDVEYQVKYETIVKSDKS
jgi:hypothetical protein